ALGEIASVLPVLTSSKAVLRLVLPVLTGLVLVGTGVGTGPKCFKARASNSCLNVIMSSADLDIGVEDGCLGE
ncbi:hypothetical protein Tco_0549900, partial [Tanacetum coccineum]